MIFFCVLSLAARAPVIVTQAQKNQLEQIVRARIILGLSSGMKAEAVAQALSTSMPPVNKWRGRWKRNGFAGLEDAEGRGRKPSLSAKAVGKALSLSPTRAVYGGACSVREMAAHTGLSKSSVQRLWAARGIAPHGARAFEPPNDLQVEEKYWDVVGLYLNRPQNAVVLCCDEKSQCQVLERTQTGLLLGQGHIRTRTHDSCRHGNVTLFAAPGDLSGKVAHAASRHRHNEWLAFLNKIVVSVPEGKDIPIIRHTRMPCSIKSIEPGRLC